MDLIYDIFDELTGNPSDRPEATDLESSANEGEDRNWSSSTERSPTGTNPRDGDEEFSFFDVNGRKEADPRGTPQGSSADSRTWERHTKNIQGEYSKASDPDQNRKVSKALESFGPKEGWLNLDDLDLTTQPSEFPPPSRPAPMRDTASSPSSSGQDHTEGDQKGKEKEKFFEKVTMTRKISYELVEEDVYDDEQGGDGGKLEDLIDISIVDSEGNEEKCAPDLTRKAEKQIGKVAKAIKEDLSVLFGDTSVPFGRKTAADQKGKGKGVVGGASGMHAQQHSSDRVSSSKGVEEMKQRDLKRQREMEEMERAADELEAEFKKWSAGKEGNLRALLSSLHKILGPESGWQPVSIQDLLNSTSVRKQYRRATLLVHPDKLQQKGASPQQKYIAEKVFGLLKDASKKFNSEELF